MVDQGNRDTPEPTTPVAAGWRWTDTACGPVLTNDALAALASHAITSRALRFRENASADYEQLAQLFGVTGQDVQRVTQVHGRVVVTVSPGEPLVQGLEADAIVSTDPSRVIAVRCRSNG